MIFSIPQTELIDISEWEKEEEDLSVNYPRGTLDKVTYQHEGERYLFKHAWTRVKERENYSEEILHQVWVELVASYIASQLGVKVPETALAGSRHHDFEYGVLSKWFVNAGEIHISGADFLRSKMENYDESKHNLTDILRYSEEENIADNKRYWAEVLLFDCLIGNTDRHHENWEIIESEDMKRFAPAFDNGVALGFRVADTELGSFDHGTFVKKFRLKIPLQSGGAKPNIKQAVSFMGEINLNIQEFVNRLNVDKLAKDIEISQTEMNPQLSEKYRLSDARKEFIIAFIRYRKHYILNAFGS